jgi:uncharacterized membrane-anchored protein
MTRRRKLAFALVVALQALTPLALIGWSEVALARGREVVLRTVPVDPVDLFRGRYVALRYEISTLGGEYPPGTTVYVPLYRQGDHWTGSVSTRGRPDSGVFIRGRVAGNGRIMYGIETYYADEDEAPRLEREAAGGLLVRVSIDANGKARIKGIEVR